MLSKFVHWKRDNSYIELMTSAKDFFALELLWNRWIEFDETW